jgi:hypothetical protein
MIEQAELDQLTKYLCDLFGESGLAVLTHPEEEDQALVVLERNFFGRITRDEDEGEISYDFSRDIPDAPHDELDAALKDLFNNDNVQLRKRPNKSDSAEIYRGEEFLGVLYDDEGSIEGMQVFNMAILEIDLDDGLDSVERA